MPDPAVAKGGQVLTGDLGGLKLYDDASVPDPRIEVTSVEIPFFFQLALYRVWYKPNTLEIS
jgi:hypothetical protein